MAIPPSWARSVSYKRVSRGFDEYIFKLFKTFSGSIQFFLRFANFSMQLPESQETSHVVLRQLPDDGRRDILCRSAKQSLSVNIATLRLLVNFKTFQGFELILLLYTL